MKNIFLLSVAAVFLFVFFGVSTAASAQTKISLPSAKDTDQDGIIDAFEKTIFHTDSAKADTDGDGYTDGLEVQNGYNPLDPSPEARIKRIEINLQKQSLDYYNGNEENGSFLIASGMNGWETPAGYFNVVKKKLYVDYIAYNYNYPHIKYNLLFSKSSHDGLGLFIHSAPWRKKFGVRGSHGCVNVSTVNMEKLYAWADDKTFIHIF